MATEFIIDNSPSITDWITAVSAVLALIGVVVSSVYLKRQHDAQANERAQAQAAKVWAAPIHGPHAHVHNDSDLPIYNIQVMLAHKESGEHLSSGPLPLSQLAPRQDMAMLFEWSAGHTPTDPNKLRVLVAFEDAAGVRWRRDFVGHLSQAPVPKKRG